MPPVKGNSSMAPPLLPPSDLPSADTNGLSAGADEAMTTSTCDGASATRCASPRRSIGNGVGVCVCVCDAKGSQTYINATVETTPHTSFARSPGSAHTHERVVDPAKRDACALGSKSDRQIAKKKCDCLQRWFVMTREWRVRTRHISLLSKLVRLL